MTKTTFLATQLEEALNVVRRADKDFPEYPLVLNPWGDDPEIWSEDFYPITLRQVGDDRNVRVTVEDYFGGEEGGDHRMYIILRVGYGDDARYFEKTGEYNSWDTSYWDGGFYEVEAQELKKIEWVAKK